MFTYSKDCFQKLDVVVELERRKTTVDIKVPQRFTLVIDVSGSMSQPVNEYDHRTLMERVKVRFFFVFDLHYLDFRAIIFCFCSIHYSSTNRRLQNTSQKLFCSDNKYRCLVHVFYLFCKLSELIACLLFK